MLQLSRVLRPQLLPFISFRDHIWLMHLDLHPRKISLQEKRASFEELNTYDSKQDDAALRSMISSGHHTDIALLYFESANVIRFIPPGAHVCKNSRELVKNFYEVVEITAYTSQRFIWFNCDLDTLVYKQSRKYWLWRHITIPIIHNAVFVSDYPLYEDYSVEMDTWVQGLFNHVIYGLNIFPVLTTLYLS
jgi:hypothetical protein